MQSVEMNRQEPVNQLHPTPSQRHTIHLILLLLCISMLQGIGITNVGSSSRLCIRCIRSRTNGRPGASKGRTSNLSSRGYTTSTASEPGARNEHLLQSSSIVNNSKLEKESDARASTRTRATNVWGKSPRQLHGST